MFYKKFLILSLLSASYSQQLSGTDFFKKIAGFIVGTYTDRPESLALDELIQDAHNTITKIIDTTKKINNAAKNTDPRQFETNLQTLTNLPYLQEYYCSKLEIQLNTMNRAFKTLYKEDQTKKEVIVFIDNVKVLLSTIKSHDQKVVCPKLQESIKKILQEHPDFTLKTNSQ